MKFSIFSRLFFSYLLLFSMLVGLSIFFVEHLNEFNHIIKSIILEDTERMEYPSQLSDLLLAESRFDRKYIVLKDDALQESYRQARADFINILNKAKEVASPESESIFDEIDIDHEKFNHLVEVEREMITNARPYEVEQYDDKKKIITNEMIDLLNNSQHVNEKVILRKIRKLQSESAEARNVAIMITVIALVSGLLIAVLITRSITRPVNIMKAKTKEISQGNFQGDLAITSPPAIHELAVAINTMCHKLQEVETLKSDFFSHMSHELRTPLASIQEGTNLLMEGHGGQVSPKQQRILTIISQESKRMIQLVNAILDLSKMEAGMLAYHFTATDMSALINKALSALMPLAETKGITINSTIGHLPSVMVDQERMSQVFRNLLVNALKFTPEQGQITLAAEVKENSIEIMIQDTGIGIPEADLERIFLKFQQVISTTGERIKGTGLGLATVRQIILAHGGKVWATSQEKSGSTFYVSVPFSA